MIIPPFHAKVKVTKAKSANWVWFMVRLIHSGINPTNHVGSGAHLEPWTPAKFSQSLKISPKTQRNRTQEMKMSKKNGRSNLFLHIMCNCAHISRKRPARLPDEDCLGSPTRSPWSTHVYSGRGHQNLWVEQTASHYQVCWECTHTVFFVALCGDLHEVSFQEGQEIQKGFFQFHCLLFLLFFWGSFDCCIYWFRRWHCIVSQNVQPCLIQYFAFFRVSGEFLDDKLVNALADQVRPSTQTHTHTHKSQHIKFSSFLPLSAPFALIPLLLWGVGATDEGDSLATLRGIWPEAQEWGGLNCGQNFPKHTLILWGPAKKKAPGPPLCFVLLSAWPQQASPPGWVSFGVLVPAVK